MVLKLLSTQGLDDLGSKDQLQLLNAIDSLRSQGISQHVSLPQIIVCGDQSSGKSSVLEAISGVPFPVKSNTSTRFPTELILRRTTLPSIKVSIMPHDSRTDAEKKRLLGFKAGLEGFEELPSLIDRAMSAMGIIGFSKAFSDDILRIEISGPDRPHLTIVDLPGLIHSETKHQAETDIHLITTTVKKYMKEPRSIILAVVSAKNDYANQVVLRLAREADPEGNRLIGVVTKPDCLKPQSGSENMYISLIKNHEVELRHGWHVLRNRDTDSESWGLAERDAHEDDFFSSSITWGTLSPSQRGIKSLRERLSKLLLHQIASELPNLRDEITLKLNACEKEFSNLGKPRSSVQEQRLHLVEVSVALQTLIKAAVEGSHEDPFFRGVTLSRDRSGYERRIRSVVRDFNDRFAAQLIERGHFYAIFAGEIPKGTLTGDENPMAITRDGYVNKIVQILRDSRGRELPGMFNPLIVTELFQKQSSPWRSITEDHIEELWKASCLFMDHLVAYVADESTAGAIHESIVSPGLDAIRNTLHAKLASLLKPYEGGHPITNSSEFTETLQYIRSERQRSEFSKITRDFASHSERSHQYLRSVDFSPLLNELVKHTESSSFQSAASQTLDYSEAYYKVCLRANVGDFTG